MDCTYKTNRFMMALFNIIGTTPCNKTFEIGFCFVAHENEPDYGFPLKAFRGILDNQHIQYPSIALTDNEDALMNTLSNVFPNMVNLLYIWHINKNIRSHCRRLFPWHNVESPRKRAVEVEPKDTWEGFNNKVRDLFIRALSLNTIQAGVFFRMALVHILQQSITLSNNGYHYENTLYKPGPIGIDTMEILRTLKWRARMLSLSLI